MAFIQVMQLQTSKMDEVRALVEEWEKVTEGKRTVTRSYLCEDREDPGHYSVVAFFESFEDAMKNSKLPETDALSKKVSALSVAPLTFFNLDVIEVRS